MNNSTTRSARKRVRYWFLYGRRAPRGLLGPLAEVIRDRRGAVFVEFLIAFLPVQVFFLCLIQLAILYSVRLVTEHAAINGARAAAVVIGDVRTRYGGEEQHVLREDGERRRTVRKAVLLSLAPLVFTGVVQSVQVLYPPADRPGGAGERGVLRFQPMGTRSVQKIRVRVEVEAACRIGFASHIVCSSLFAFTPVGRSARSLFLPTRRVRAEAIYPYQGARYEY
jgi:hypothetical protein